MQSQWLNLPLELGKSKGESNDPLKIFLECLELISVTIHHDSTYKHIPTYFFFFF